MIRLISVAIVVGLIFESNQVELKKSLSILTEKRWPYPPYLQCWTEWFTIDDPSTASDPQTLNQLRQDNPGKICSQPGDTEVQTLPVLGGPVSESRLAIAPSCKTKECKLYRVRFSCSPPFCGGTVCWTKWYDRDDPSVTGDWETLTDLRRENPNEICTYPLYIEAVTVDTLTPAVLTGESIFRNNPTAGFVCRKMDQPDRTCLDYKVRFACPCNC